MSEVPVSKDFFLKNAEIRLVTKGQALHIIKATNKLMKYCPWEFLNTAQKAAT